MLSVENFKSFVITAVLTSLASADIVAADII